MQQQTQIARQRYQAVPHDCQNYVKKYGEKFYCELCGQELQP
jgi:rRNA maturation endonuclease Nob1